ncbi:hypothetical protein NA57DRAFT_53596 [Rhizodiscina lignyota]|uniref:Elongin-A n=1 Tax=Rhizodiscina lignyota TaxID=1504668 RepID=A0A9P4IKH5_9PEZI|nr:hypothetical protein NA57DRAFT_53596 [Rhizodiscina lignyota]
MNKSLYHMAIRRLVRSKDQLEDVGDIPYAKIRPVLVKLERPDQLRLIEVNSPHLEAHTAELWQNFLRRDVMSYEQNPVVPPEGMSWYLMYVKLKNRADRVQRRQMEEMRKKFEAHADERERNKTVINDVPPARYHEKQKRRARATTRRTTSPQSRTAGKSIGNLHIRQANPVSARDRESILAQIANRPKKTKPTPSA